MIIHVASAKSTVHSTAIIIFFVPCCIALGDNKIRGGVSWWSDFWGGGAHHSLLPREKAELAFTCMKSECPAHARRGGGDAGVSNDWGIIICFSNRHMHTKVHHRSNHQLKSLKTCNTYSGSAVSQLS